MAWRVDVAQIEFDESKKSKNSGGSFASNVSSITSGTAGRSIHSRNQRHSLLATNTTGNTFQKRSGISYKGQPVTLIKHKQLRPVSFSREALEQLHRVW